MAQRRRRVGILGSGEVARSLGTGFARHGFDVMLGSRDPSKLHDWRDESPGPRRVGTFDETARRGELVILATLGTATEAAIRLVGAGAFDGKIVVDATNPLEHSGGSGVGLSVGLTDSMGERVQRALPGARVVKCFNTVPHTRMIDPEFSEGTPRMLICGEDLASKQAVATLLQELGWPGVIDVGGIEAARWLEALVPLWVRVSSSEDRWDGAFKFVH